MGDTTVPDPGFLPYYQQSFFDTIRRVYIENPVKVNTMSIKEWSTMLTEENLTMDNTDMANKQYRPCRAEIYSPTTDWSLCWRLCRLKGLGSELTSFNRLLVTKERYHVLTPAVSPLCPLCSLDNEDLQHAFITCNFNQDVGNKLLDSVKNIIPDISAPALLRLELSNLSEDLEYTAVFYISNILMYIWEKRMTKSRIAMHDIRATLEAKCILLRKTRLQGRVPLMEEMLRNLWNYVEI